MPNRLAHEKSPYLLQHANNPVDWFPWGREAFELAKQQDKPIFLSIGYSTCHWCHVMERESFNSAETASILNANFINVKVDREERPDIDRVFMTYVQMTTGHGGWPMSIFLTPSLQPIFGATYIPPRDTPHGKGFNNLCVAISEQFKTTKPEVLAQASQAAEQLKQAVTPQIAELPKDKSEIFQPANADRIILKCLDDFEASFDSRFGGFDTKPKFPSPVIFTFLSHAHCRLLCRVREAARKFTKEHGAQLQQLSTVEQDPDVLVPGNEPELPIGDASKPVTEEAEVQAQEFRSQAQAAFSDGNVEEAIAAITRAIQTNPTLGNLYAIRANFLLQSGRPLSAIRDCDQALEISQVNARAFKVRGKAKAKIGKWEEAVFDLAKGQQIDYDEDTFELIKRLQTEKVPKAAERRKLQDEIQRQQQQIGITEAKATHCLHMMLFSLHCISQGGITDHLGGGFSRYSVDEFWHVPHFEKMLYDNAQMALAYTLAVQADRKALYSRCVRDTLAYIQRDMTAPEGGFLSAEDADSLPGPTSSAKEEGAFYVWSAAEVRELVKDIHPKAAEVVFSSFGIREEGNVRPGSDPHGQLRGKNVLFLAATVDHIQQHTGVPADQIAVIVDKCRQRLVEARAKRPRPARDDKIIAAWNGLMISAFARASQVLGDDSYLVTARKAITFVRQNMYHDDQTVLLRSWRGGASSVPGFHTDYSFFIQGLLDTYHSTGNPEMLRWAETLQVKVDTAFADGHGGYYDVAQTDPYLPARLREEHDGAEPAANSVTAMNLWRLGHMLQKEAYLERGRTAVLSMHRQMQAQPRSTTQLLTALDLYSQPGVEVVVVGGEPQSAPVKELLEPVHTRLIVRKVIVFYNASSDVFANSAYLQGLGQTGGKPTVHVFSNWQKVGSATTVAELEQHLTSLHVI